MQVQKYIAVYLRRTGEEYIRREKNRSLMQYQLVGGVTAIPKLMLNY